MTAKLNISVRRTAASAMKAFFVAAISFCCASVFAQEKLFQPKNSVSPDGEFYGAVIPIFASDPPNGNPYRIAIREISTGKVIGSEISQIDMTSRGSLEETEIIWTATGRFAVFLMSSDRRTRVARIFYVNSKSRTARSVQLPDYFQNMLGQIGKVETPEYHFESVKTLEGDRIEIAVSAGDRNAKYSCEGRAVVQLCGDPHSEPGGRLEAVSVE